MSGQFGLNKLGEFHKSFNISIQEKKKRLFTIMICHLKHTDLMLLVYLLKQQRYATVIYGMDSDKTRQADECEYVEKGLSKAGYHSLSNKATFNSVKIKIILKLEYILSLGHRGNEINTDYCKITTLHLATL